MVRKIVLFAGFALGVSVLSAFAEDTKPAKKGKTGPIDKGKLFEKLDTDQDGKLSKDEYTKGIEGIKELLAGRAAERGKKAAEKFDADKTFEKIDTDKDGFLSKDEFEKFKPMEAVRKKTE